MAGDWLKFETATLDKPEVWAIAQDLNIDPDAVIGKLLRVWSWFDQQSTIGNAPSVTKALLDRCAGVTGFCDSVIKAGWMIDDGRFLSLPNFERHNGTTAKTRAQTGKRVKNHRAKDDSQCNATSVTKALPEKRREEKINYKDINTLPAKAVSVVKQSNGLALLSEIDNLPEQVAEDFLKVRKAKRSPLTATALALIEREAVKAGLTTAQAIAIAAARGWQSFKADWIADNDGKTTAERTQDFKDRQAEKAYAPLLDMTPEERAAWGFK